VTDPEQVNGLLAGLARRGVTEVDASTLSRGLYASDASLYRVVPAAVVRPRHVDEVLATVEVAAEHELPVTSRGAGTSCAGNAIGPGVVIDFARHLNRIDTVQRNEPGQGGYGMRGSRGGGAGAGWAVVQPGVVHASLQRVALGYGLRFGPDPSTHTRCTVGGMVGNNACGSRALGYGRTADNVLGLDVLTGDGERLSLGAHTDASPAGIAAESATVRALRDLGDSHLEVLRTQLGRFGRQLSGYGLQHLLPEHGRDVARALVGSEGSLAVVLGATVRLVDEPAHRLLVVLGYPSMPDAADAVPAVLRHAPVACEGLDARITDVVRARRGAGAVPPLPRGSGWLFVELAGAAKPALAAQAAALTADAGALGHEVVADPRAAARLWRIREDGAGLAAGGLRGKPAHAGWEDAAVPPDRLGDYLRAFETLTAEHDLVGAPYGHFGDGCVHVRLDFPLAASDGVPRFGAFLDDAARLVSSYGGSLSGEHGDGRARSELLPLMYTPEAMQVFAEVKQLFDPHDRLNPGIVVRPRPVLTDLRPPRVRHQGWPTVLRLVDDGDDLSQAVHRCTGVGSCLADPGEGGVMCPSYAATRDEKDSTRGRARVLQEMIDGSLVTGGWRAPEVHAALELCLACKGCVTDCPTGVDMATYKAEVLHHSYQRRLRPRSHYTLGQLPRWIRLAAPLRRVVNTAARVAVTARFAKWLAGIDQRRALPRLADRPLRDGARSRYPTRPTPPAGQGGPGQTRPRVVLWGDTFTNDFAPESGRAAVRVLETAGYAVEVLPRASCCGLTWISTGQLDAARRVLGRTMRTLAVRVDAGDLVLGLEPSCTAVLRDDAVRLLRGAERSAAARVAAATRTLAELLLAAPNWNPPDLSGVQVVVQPHCHHASVLGWQADAEVLASTGVSVRRVGGCCGLAGNFGVEAGHHDVSVAIAEQQLLPAVRTAQPGAWVLADGFSCRTQLADLAGISAVHLADFLDSASPSQPAL